MRLGVITKKLEKFKYFAYANRLPGKKRIPQNQRDLIEDVETLKRDGTLVLENFISKEDLILFKKDIDKRIEGDCSFELPCLSQNKVNSELHKDIIDNKFRYSNEKLNQMGLCFTKKDIQSYQQVLNDFKPSTLKILLEDKVDHLNLWLNPYILKLVEEYMGIIPYMTEAYTRRNFPSDYKVMNHNWHRDENHEDHLLKAFFFFTDCDVRHGPHEFVLGTHRDFSLAGKTYYEENEVDTLYPVTSKRRFVSTVKAGTVILEDTRGLHRASVPVEGFRDLGFAIFMPAPFWRPQKLQNYSISEKVFFELSENQRKYIPKCCVS